ncbi:hypothetical protein L596_014834 [Steinernema carpocapsae]|uniref:Uncharacterized protein n=1 Tax=Steinernema carpocapsae TaxID=34508 RepID=A0A4U5ND14_STECR|nr:hypothetical protein L596_014834 [Steinernema carpocapsae]
MSSIPQSSACRTAPNQQIGFFGFRPRDAQSLRDANRLLFISGAFSAMGGSSSSQPRPLVMEPIQAYPDMNMIFKGIPKMMQVADDMHRMTDYIQDLRNMTLALGVLSFIGMFFFLLIKLKGNRRRSRRRQYAMQAQRPMPYTPEPWERSNSNHKIDMEKLRLSQSGSHHDFNPMTTSDHIQSNGGPMHKRSSRVHNLSPLVLH